MPIRTTASGGSCRGGDSFGSERGGAADDCGGDDVNHCEYDRNIDDTTIVLEGEVLPSTLLIQIFSAPSCDRHEMLGESWISLTPLWSIYLGGATADGMRSDGASATWNKRSEGIRSGGVGSDGVTWYNRSDTVVSVESFESSIGPALALRLTNAAVHYPHWMNSHAATMSGCRTASSSTAPSGRQ